MLVVIISGRANPYTKFYTDWTKDITLQNIEPLVGDPQLTRGTDQKKDFENMAENGYVMLGYSSFSGADVDEEDAIKQAKKINASKAIVYKTYTNSVSGTTRITTPTTQTSRTNLSGSVYGGAGYAAYSGTGTTTTYGSRTTYVPYTIDRYDYFASYWARAKKFRLGTYVTDLDADKRAEIKSNKGVVISAVVKGSPAYNADIFKGDILKKIGDVDIYDTEKYTQAIDKYEGRKTEIEIYRGGEILIKNIEIQTIK